MELRVFSIRHLDKVQLIYEGFLTSYQTKEFTLLTLNTDKTEDDVSSVFANPSNYLSMIKMTSFALISLRAESVDECKIRYCDQVNSSLSVCRRGCFCRSTLSAGYQGSQSAEPSSAHGCICHGDLL